MKIRRSAPRAPASFVASLAVLLVVSSGIASGARAQQGDDPRPSDLPSGLDASSSAARSSGRVVDRTGAAIEGVAVTLSPRAGGAAVGPLTTDRKGRWLSPPIPAGRYDIVLEKDGFLTSDGFVDVSGRPGESIVVELRSLDVVTPAFAEGDPEASIRGWLDKANDLLEQGRSEEARAEYEKALRYLRGERRAEVLRAIARTHYLEGDAAATLESLVSALEAAPASEQTRSLYRTLMEQLERSDEANRMLAELDAHPPTPEAPAPAPRRRAPPIPEAVDAVAHRTGVQTVRFAERSPLSTPARVFGAYGLEVAQARDVVPDALTYDLGEESFALIVPEAYDPEEEWGVVVWISPTPRGGVSAPEVVDLLGRSRLIWVGANRAGNPRAKWDRIALALDAAHNVAELYSVDPRRVVVAGYSGGGRTAASAAISFPEAFDGLVCWFGADYFRKIPVPYKPGHSWPAAFEPPSRKVLENLHRDLRIALVTGTRDFNRAETAGVLGAMREDGFEHVTYLEIPDADHYHGLDVEWLGRALAVVAPD